MKFVDIIELIFSYNKKFREVKNKDNTDNKNSNLNEQKFQNLFINENSILWNRNYSNNIDPENPKIFSDLKFVLNKYNCRYKLIGHTAYTEGVKIKYNGHVICIDTAMSTAFGKKRNKFDRIHFVEIIKNKVLIK